MAFSSPSPSSYPSPSLPYPQAPWTLTGYAIQTLQLIDNDLARPHIPPELDIVSVWPGKTLGGIYVSSYQLGSVIQYNELIVNAAMVSYSGRIGAWISHIYVDNENSLLGGREIWGLPKEMAEFTWENSANPGVTVSQGNRQLCSLTYSKQSFAWQVPLNGGVFSALGSNILFFKGEFSSRAGLVSGKLTVPAESPFASLNLEQPFLTVYCDDMRLVAGAPEAVGQRSVEFSYS